VPAPRTIDHAPLTNGGDTSADDTGHE
jgi:hypothetical protein